MSEHRQLRGQTRALLNSLGICPDDVAESLRAAGVHGIPRNNRSCAVALYLSALMGSDPRVRSIKVGHCSLLIDTVSAPGLGHRAACRSSFPSRSVNSSPHLTHRPTRRS